MGGKDGINFVHGMAEGGEGEERAQVKMETEQSSAVEVEKGDLMMSWDFRIRYSLLSLPGCPRLLRVPVKWALTPVRSVAIRVRPVGALVLPNPPPVGEIIEGTKRVPGVAVY